MPLFQQTTIARGTTVVFLSQFFDEDGNLINPTSAVVNVEYNGCNGVQQQIPMVAPGTPGGDPVYWSAQWDSRGADPGVVYWSIHSGQPGPYSVEDGQFTLTANKANLLTF